MGGISNANPKQKSGQGPACVGATIALGFALSPMMTASAQDQAQIDAGERRWLRIRPKLTHKPMQRSGRVRTAGLALYLIENITLFESRWRTHFWTAG